ncbi:hypothetical protein [Pedobacter paludis]|uniref:Uncharacterized protein n=1 Tax=Pedobacter paludis TaxID=2203212 RepID=A0A317F584_9SPHI|nr:hypothetical protein [Pedobacter paludis]PWS32658.1 hypothetical protein DF947_06195 [Pedobacter paludis]
MSKIRSIADEIRERIKAESEAVPVLEKPAVPVVAKSAAKGKVVSADVSQLKIYEFFEELSAFRMEGTQKIVIRLDPASMKLLKQLKFTRDIDMTKVIVFAFSKFLNENHWLKAHVKELLKKNDNELD